jgi:hypothetical protein
VDYIVGIAVGCAHLGDADTDRNPDRANFMRDFSGLQRQPHPLRRHPSEILPGFGQQYQKLLSTPAEYRIGFAKAVPANPYHCNQHLVADVMPPSVLLK